LLDSLLKRSRKYVNYFLWLSWTINRLVLWWRTKARPELWRAGWTQCWCTRRGTPSPSSTTSCSSSPRSSCSALYCLGNSARTLKRKKRNGKEDKRNLTETLRQCTAELFNCRPRHFHLQFSRCILEVVRTVCFNNKIIFNSFIIPTPILYCNKIVNRIRERNVRECKLAHMTIQYQNSTR